VKGLEIEFSRMWKVGTKTVPVIIAASGTIKKGLDQNIQLLPGHHRATGDLTKEHCTQHLYSAGGNYFDILLKSGLTGEFNKTVCIHWFQL
jgi:hypothetical protein